MYNRLKVNERNIICIIHIFNVGICGNHVFGQNPIYNLFHTSEDVT